ncbi:MULTISPECIES: anhydro-N-acetylmuramic acid kinase AnmK [Peribacillus]|uniref:anhydro-N-acetylmuramic acid kinase AnmK n=1 Tax=Peribacillus TaxID=2675229 RepID=UPI001914081E|nr:MULTISPECIES: anhydro-N-acetylmuramic acid kinase AnmK [unclassified Peribacillus]MBK5442263.1 anhydro-N-acetylmuramic acid kinase [Peribacillus sp. TH24]MBK5462987.1 anhydro-N-acetylmuramic acid kinase [Peribacillus sp. TH27]MBK5483669.1 anhydro-N-acetylmuramic acid kinase [Peribacillus sp. TH16]MBK5501171.1 anhydro-N-acetylmuramic acid kinase [Peribacillus sp. TH14]WMX53860.1 anhydro-N-acetylmuramic acid kinase AnmK [Peribacillus sp. R9-11]
MYIVGLMSGTSLDGIDAALVRVNNTGLKTEIEMIEFITYPFPKDIEKEIMQSLSVETSNVQLICSLNFKLGKLFSDATKEVCEKAGLPIEQLDLIGSHGQTIYHQPLQEQNWVPSTLQIGEPAVIAHDTNTIVISNFRTMDMAAGGQGAPLVPFTEYILYRSETKGRLLQNIGGIGNVTVLPKQASLNDMYAFDTGPGNMIIDEVCRQLFNLRYDEGGKIAKQGLINEELLSYCFSHPYIMSPPPKSTGRELFGRQYVVKLLKMFESLPSQDILATVTMFTAKSIVENYRAYIFPITKIEEVIIGGGGSYNKTLLEMIQSLLGNSIQVLTQEELGYSSEAKEAVAFALLANETFHGNPSNVPKATGAKNDVILGNITFPPSKSLN